MDADSNGSIDRIEWVSYLAGPPLGIYQLGNKDYYDFDLREIFEKYDTTFPKGKITKQDFRNILKLDFGTYYSELTQENQENTEHLFEALERQGMNELKQLALASPNKFVFPNKTPDLISWVEFSKFRSVLNRQKADVQAQLVLIRHEQKKIEQQNQMQNDAMNALQGLEF